MATISIETNTESLSSSFKKIEFMKWLLDLDNYETDFTINDLQKNIENSCLNNYAHLVVFHHYISMIPTAVKRLLQKITEVRYDKRLYEKYYKRYINSFEKNQEFYDYDTYIILNRSRDVVSSFNGNTEENLEKLKAYMLGYKRIEAILSYQILLDSSQLLSSMSTKEFIHLLPELFIWISENKHNPIDNLTDDDCEILAGLFYGFDYDKMLNLNLSSSAKNYQTINHIINDLPKKFNVKNITQVMFRMVLLKPLVWNLPTHENIVRTIKDINNVL